MSVAAAAEFTIPSLDGIRAISVLIVVLAHAGYGHLVPGGLGVTIFFFLSGYLITTLFIREHDSTKTVAIPAFYARRMLRLFPPLLLTLLIAYTLTATGLLPGGVSVGGLASQLLYFANYHAIFFGAANAVPAGTGILWSLAVEEHFYLVYPFLVFAAIRFRLSRSSCAAVLGVVCLAVLAWRFHLATGADFFENRTYYASDTRFDSILFGCILALVANPALKTDVTTFGVSDFCLLAASLGLLLVTLIIRDPLFRETLRYSLQGIALLPMFYYAIKFSRHPLFSWLNARPLRRLGVYSYCVYLIHFVVLRLMFEQIPWLKAQPALAFAGGLLASVAFAFLVDRYIDPFFRRLRHQLRSNAKAVTSDSIPMVSLKDG
jgi:peptidoglycan/LPS O-acetylase OafA/YrhL